MKSKITEKRVSEIVNDIHEGMCRARVVELREAVSSLALESSRLRCRLSLVRGDTLAALVYAELGDHGRCKDKLGEINKDIIDALKGTNAKG